MKIQAYYRPTTAALLYAALEEETAPVQWLAGATDVLVQARGNNRFADKAFFDLSAMEELKSIKEEEDFLVIGSGITFSRLAEDPLVKCHAPLLAQAAAQVGAVQLRNRATIGGNVANASPAGDSLGPLAVLDAVLCLDALGLKRKIPFLDFILSPGKTILGEKEFIRAFYIPKLSLSAHSKFYKVGRRNAMAISRLTISLVGTKDAADCVSDMRIAVGAVFPRPMRFLDVESIALGSRLSDSVISQIANAMAVKIPQIAGRRSSTVYKQPVCEMALNRLLGEMRSTHEI